MKYAISKKNYQVIWLEENSQIRFKLFNFFNFLILSIK